jgi:putative ABC transport system substrate-binding protein
MIKPRRLVVGAAFMLVTSVVGTAQPPKIARIGVLSGDTPPDSPCVERLRRGLSDLGYREGQTHVLEVRWAKGRTEAFPALAAELVRLKVDLIVSAAAPAAPVVKEATATIPIVLASSFYPVETGVIASLAHPGGNITGVTHFTPELMEKRVQLLNGSRRSRRPSPRRLNPSTVR